MGNRSARMEPHDSCTKVTSKSQRDNILSTAEKTIYQLIQEQELPTVTLLTEIRDLGSTTHTVFMVVIIITIELTIINLISFETSKVAMQILYIFYI